MTRRAVFVVRLVPLVALATLLAGALAGRPAWGHSFPAVHTVVVQVDRCELTLLVGFKPASGASTSALIAQAATPSGPHADTPVGSLRDVLTAYALAPLSVSLGGHHLTPSKVQAKVAIEPGGARPLVVVLVTYALAGDGELVVTTREPRTTRFSWQDQASERVDLATAPAQDRWFDAVASFLLKVRGNLMRNYRRTILGLGLVLAGTLAACADHAYDPEGPAVDPNAPAIAITSPDRGKILGNVTTVDVTGTASDDTAVASVTVNGVPAAVAADGTWKVTVPVTPGTDLLHAVATDNAGNTGKASRSVVAGPMASIKSSVNDAITASLSAQTFDAIGRAAAGYVTTANLESMISAHNPVIDDGAPNGPDCLYVQGSITSMTVGGANIGLVPMHGGLNIDAELQNVNIGMHLDYAVACINGSRDITIFASNISVKGPMTIAANAGQFDVALDSPDVTLTGFDLELGGIPGDIVDLLDLNAAMGPIIGWAVEKFMTPVINNAFAGLNSSKTVDVMGTPVAVNMAPDSIDFETTGAIIKLDTSMRATGDDASPGFVNVPTTTPTMNTAQGFELAVAQGAADQLLASLWAAHGLDKTFDLTTGSYGQIGTLYDSVQIQTLGLPYIDATGDGLKLTLGDLMVSFMNGEIVATEIAVNAEVEIKVTADPTTGALKLDVGTPTTYVDVLNDNVQGANQLSNATFEAITSFALSRVVSYGSSAVGAIPLPSIGGVSMSNVTVAAQTGYLVVDGSVH